MRCRLLPVLAAGALLVPVLGVPASAACAPTVTASARILQVQLPVLPVPITPPRNASASVKQVGEGEDSASGSTNQLRLPVTGGAFQVTNGTGQAAASASVASGVGTGSSSARVDGFRATVPATPVTPDLVITATVLQATADVVSNSVAAASATFTGVQVNGQPLPAPNPDGSYDLPGGLGRLVVAELEVDGDPSGSRSAASTVLSLELTGGVRVVVAQADAAVTGC